MQFSHNASNDYDIILQIRVLIISFINRQLVVGPDPNSKGSREPKSQSRHTKLMVLFIIKTN